MNSISNIQLPEGIAKQVTAGKTGRAVSDADGWLTLEFADTAHEIFFLRTASEQNSDWLKQLQKRKELFQESQTLGALIP